MGRRRVGVEEELLLVDHEHGWPAASAATVLRRPHPGHVGGELKQEQVEIDTEPCEDVGDLLAQVRRWRSAAEAVAHRAGARVAALATCPLPVEAVTTPDERYVRIAGTYGLTEHEQLVCGLHVHVDVDDDEEGVQALDRSRLWLPVLTALSANSPFWQGRDTAYASFRSQLVHRWPTAGPGGPMGSAAEYRRLVAAMLATGSVLDEGMVYFDARLSRHYPTLEIRVADVCLRAEDTVVLAALARALVDTGARLWRAGEPVTPVRTELLRVVAWRAGRSGTADVLVHPQTLRPVPAWEAVEALVEHVRDSLEEHGDLATVREGLAALRARGTGSTWQRQEYAGTGDLGRVTLAAADVTVGG